MSINYRAAIVVGLPKEDMPHVFEGLLDPYDSGLGHFSPYFDAPYHYGVFGIAVIETDDHCEEEIDTGNFGVKLRDAQHKFHAITGLAGKLYLTPVGW